MPSHGLLTLPHRYNGGTYAKGVTGKTLGKFHENNIIRFETGRVISCNRVTLGSYFGAEMNLLN
jgi:hypothetical protein